MRVERDLQAHLVDDLAQIAFQMNDDSKVLDAASHIAIVIERHDRHITMFENQLAEMRKLVEQQDTALSMLINNARGRCEAIDEKYNEHVIMLNAQIQGIWRHIHTQEADLERQEKRRVLSKATEDNPTTVTSIVYQTTPRDKVTYRVVDSGSPAPDHITIYSNCMHEGEGLGKDGEGHLYITPNDMTRIAREWLAYIGADVPQPTNDRPTIVTLCGSTSFHHAFQRANLYETLAGRIVLTVGCDTKGDDDLFATMDPEALAELKSDLDHLHLRKIDMADEILVLNVNGYVGESTAREIRYAYRKHKRIRWLEPDKAIDPATATKTGIKPGSVQQKCLICDEPAYAKFSLCEQHVADAYYLLVETIENQASPIIAELNPPDDEPEPPETPECAEEVQQ